MSSKSRFASNTMFAALAVESEGEESEEEQVTEPEAESTTSSSTAEPPAPSIKMTKTAMKKAARAARLERQQQQAKTQTTTNGISASDSVPSVPNGGSASAVSQPQTTLDVEPIPSLTTESPTIAAAEPVQLGPPTTQPSEPPQPLKPETFAPPPSDKPPKEASSPSEMPTKEAPPATQPDPESVKKRQNAVTRTLWTFIMIGGFIGLLLMGHAYMVLLVMLCQTLVYREVTRLFSLKSATPESRDAEDQRGKDPWSKTLNWYFFAVTNYFLYGESIIYYFKHVVFSDAQMLLFATNHRLISFTLYTIGLMGFVLSLKKGYLKQQFGLFCWVHMSLLLIVVSSHFIVNNILEGLIWFWVPASLVICNDVFAYVWGITIGRTPLIKLSPKKTVEGFIGAFGSTVLFSLLWGTYFMRFNYMICPVHDLGVSAWSSVDCVPNPVFVWRDWQIWAPLAAMLSALFGRPITTIPYLPYQLHLLFMSCFASLVAPFGGFFASGFKRAFNIKDFGHSIPGHGGMTDRMDCQFLMGVFTYVYHSSLIRQHNVTVGSILQTIVSGLTIDEQLELVADLHKYLEGIGAHIPCN